MDLLKAHKRRSRLSETVYIGLNISLAIALFLIVRESQSAWPAYMLILLSKWRALAVRPRFWFANLVANMVDIIVGISSVVLLYSAGGALWLQIAITVLYIGWLLFIKPRSSRRMVAIQAGVAVFFGITALSIVSYAWDSIFFVAAMWLIGYVSTRHVLGGYEESQTTLYSMVGGFVFAELGWVGYHWLMAYPLVGFGQIQLSQLALFVTLLSFIAERSYASYHKYGVVRRSEILLPIILTIAIMCTTYIFAIIFGSDAL